MATSHPAFSKRHLGEYLLFGAIAAIAYCIPLVLFLNNNSYQNFYYLFIGNGLFMFTILVYGIRLVYMPYDRKRAVSMMMAGNLASLTGVVLSAVFALVLLMFFFPGSEQARPAGTVIPNAPGTSRTIYHFNLFFMILADVVLGNTTAGVFISVITSYVFKLNQTKDKPAQV